jgi:hypothetical protein
MPKNKIFATVEKIIRSKIWLTADQGKFYLPIEIYPSAKIGECVEIHSGVENSTNDFCKRLEEIIN